MFVRQMLSIISIRLCHQKTVWNTKANYSNDSDCMYILSFTALQLRDSRAEQYINRLEKLNIISASYDSAFQYAFKTTDELRQELKAINDAGSSYQKDQIDSEMGGDGA